MPEMSQLVGKRDGLPGSTTLGLVSRHTAWKENGAGTGQSFLKTNRMHTSVYIRKAFMRLERRLSG